MDAKPRDRGALLGAVVWVASYAAARLWVGALPFGSPWVYAAAALPVLPFFLVVRELLRSARAGDELERRIQLEALAVGFMLAMLLLMVLGLLEIGVELNRQDWAYRHAWAFLPLFYVVGLMAARRRYGQ